MEANGWYSSVLIYGWDLSIQTEQVQGGGQGRNRSRDSEIAPTVTLFRMYARTRLWSVGGSFQLR